MWFPSPRAASRARLRARAPAALALIALCPLALTACSDTLQDKPVPHNELESLMMQPYPVYWLGGSFHGYRITEASQDPGGAATIQYGDCVEGGQSTCVTPVRVVTSPDNSFIPFGHARHSTASLRGVPAVVAERGKAVLFATGPVIVAIYAVHPSLAAAASKAVVPINTPCSPGDPLPIRAPDTGFTRRPLPTQVPSPPLPLRGSGA
jgi:hypothetical protein